MSRSVQLELPWEKPYERPEAFCKRKRYPRWFYVYNSRRDEMLMMGEDGVWYWIPRDTINNTPHLFNTWHGAKSMCCTFGKGVPTKYQWKK